MGFSVVMNLLKLISETQTEAKTDRWTAIRPEAVIVFWVLGSGCYQLPGSVSEQWPIKVISCEGHVTD